MFDEEPIRIGQPIRTGVDKSGWDAKKPKLRVNLVKQFRAHVSGGNVPQFVQQQMAHGIRIFPVQIGARKENVSVASTVGYATLEPGRMARFFGA